MAAKPIKFLELHYTVIQFLIIYLDINSYHLNRLGAHFLNESVGIEQDIDVAQIIVHKYFNNPLQFSNDVALLKLAKPAKLNKVVDVACLPDSHHYLSENKTCWITGWETTGFRRKYTEPAPGSFCAARLKATLCRSIPLVRLIAPCCVRALFMEA